MDGPELPGASRGALRNKAWLAMVSSMLPHRDNGRSPADGTELLQPPGSTREGPEAASIGEAEDFGLDRKKDSRSA